MRTASSYLWLLLRMACFAALAWAIAYVCFRLGAAPPTGSMMLLLAVLAVATFGNRTFALSTSVAASVAYSWYFVEESGSLRITGVQGAVTSVAMLLTAITASQLSLRARRRTEEAVHRREEMERLHKLGSALLAAQTVVEAAENAVQNVVHLFDLQGAALRIEGESKVFHSGETFTDIVSVISLHADGRRDVLELYGRQPSEEVRQALSSMLSLVLERARSSEERARLESTQRGEELRSTVLNALAHNFRTPLTSIKAAASMLRGSVNIASPGERDLIAVVDEEADRLDQLIGESLDLAKIEGRRANPRTEECFFPEIVERVTSRVARYLGRRKFFVDVPEDLPSIMGDKFLLEQMLVQVVDNAWKYSRPGSCIQISGEASGDAILLTVRNEGSEIPEAERTRIFDKFYRGSKDRSRVEGTGLGLAIAKTIAEAYQGRVWLDMESSGPAFRFALPLETKGMKSDHEPHYLIDRR